ncbi:MAG: SGNH/GDSL hydrolase family protein, partial [Rhodanobacter sp.]
MNQLRHGLAWVAAGVLCLTTVGALAGGADRQPAWVDAWTAAPDTAGPVLNAQTVRQVVRTSVAGTQLRIRISNLFGATAVTLGPA